ncbi:MAG: hypothetical protein ACRD2F_02820 [Terriglobales bacterium]
MRVEPGSAVRFGQVALRGSLVLALAAALASAAVAQSRSTPIRISLPPAAVLELANSSAVAGGTGQAVVAAPGGGSVLYLSYRASQSGGAALTVAAQPAGSSVDGIIVALQGPAPAEGSFASRQPFVSPQTGPVVLWRGGPGAHGWNQRVQVRYAAPSGAPGGPVMLVYTLAVS